MFNNPWVRKAFELFSALAVMSFLSKHPLLGQIATVVAGVFATGIWMLRFHRDVMHRLYRDENWEPFVVQLCRLSGEPLPNDAGARPGMPEPATATRPRTPENPVGPVAAAATVTHRLRLVSDPDHFAAARLIKDQFRGYDWQVEAVLEQIRCNTRLRQSSRNMGLQTPRGIFLMVGRSGLGKRSVASAIGEAVYGVASVVTLDASSPGAVEAMIAATAENPYRTIILEQVESAAEGVYESLERIAAGVPLRESSTGAPVSFSDTMLVLLIHRDAGSLPVAKRQRGANTGETVGVDLLSHDTGLPRRIAWLAHAVLPFTLPPPIVLAEVVLLVMQRECLRYQIDLGKVSPAIIAREVELIVSAGSFDELPGRASRRLKQVIVSAHSSGRRYVELSIAG